MRYIPATTKQARLWVDAVSKSLKIEKSEASQIYARLCGFNSWDQLMPQIGQGEPSPSDEHVTKDILETRKRIYSERLVDDFGMNESMAEYLIDKVSPSSARKPQRFSIDTTSLYGVDPEQGVNLGELFKTLEMETGQDMNSALEQFAKETLGDSVPEDFSFDNFAERMRISKPLDPGAWYDLLKTIGWDLIEESFRSEYVYGEESFVALKEGAEVPVFITSLFRAPSDFDDEMANSVMEVVEDYALEELDCEEALLFWGQPGVKRIDGKAYTHFGMYYTEGEWHEFLINKDTSISDLFNQHNEMESIESPPESLSDKDFMLAVAAIKVTNHIDQTKRVSFSELGTKSGWNSLMPTKIE